MGFSIRDWIGPNLFDLLEFLGLVVALPVYVLWYYRPVAWRIFVVLSASSTERQLRRFEKALHRAEELQGDPSATVATAFGAAILLAFTVLCIGGSVAALESTAEPKWLVLAFSFLLAVLGWILTFAVRPDTTALLILSNRNRFLASTTTLINRSRLSEAKKTDWLKVFRPKD